jgi:hypothetical protein
LFSLSADVESMNVSGSSSTTLTPFARCFSGVYPIADLHELDGLKHGFKNPIASADGYGFIGAKSYKDSKLCLMMMANFLHTKYHKLTGISFSRYCMLCCVDLNVMFSIR